MDLKNGLGSGRAIRDRGEGVPALRVPVSGRRGSVPLCWGAGAAGDGGPRPGRRQGAKGRLSTEGQEPLDLHLQQVLGEEDKGARGGHPQDGHHAPMLVNPLAGRSAASPGVRDGAVGATVQGVGTAGRRAVG